MSASTRSQEGLRRDKIASAIAQPQNWRLTRDQKPTGPFLPVPGVKPAPQIVLLSDVRLASNNILILSGKECLLEISTVA